MIEIPGRLGIVYRRFEPGELIAPHDTPESRDAFYARQDLRDIFHDWDDYVLCHTFTVVEMLPRDVTVVVRPFDNPRRTDHVSSSAYALASPEQTALAIAARIEGRVYWKPPALAGETVLDPPETCWLGRK